MLAVAAAAAAAIATLGTGPAVGPGSLPVQQMVFGAPLPLDPPPSPVEPAPTTTLPTADQLSQLLISLTDAGVSYKQKDPMVQGGIAPDDGHALDHELRKAYRNGELPYTFDVTNIQPAGPNLAAADVAIGGPKIANPVTRSVVFAYQGDWVLSHGSAVELVQLLAQH